MSAGHAAMASGALVEAADKFEDATALYLALDDLKHSRSAIIFRATALLELGELKQAAAIVSPVGPDAEADGDTDALLGSLLLLADIALAEQHFEKVLTITDVVRERLVQSVATDYTWCMLLLRSEARIGARDAPGFWSEIESMRMVNSEPVSESIVAHRQAVEALGSVLSGDFGAGTSDGVQAVIRLANSGRPGVAGRLVAWFATVFEDAGETHLALQFLDQSATLAFTLGNRRQGLDTLHRMSRLFVKTDRPAEAIEVLERAISEAQAAGDFEEIEKLMVSALAIERAMNYPKLAVHRMLRLAELGESWGGVAERQRWLLEALMVGVHGHVPGIADIAEAVVNRLSEPMLDSMSDTELLGFAELLGQSNQFDVAHRSVMTRAERHVAEGRTRRGAELAVQLADLACAVQRSDVAESALTMAIVLGERLGILETEMWKERLEAILYT